MTLAITPQRLLELYWGRSSHPKPVHAAIPKGAPLEPANVVLWACLRADLMARLEQRADAATFDIVTLVPPKESRL